MTLLYPSGLFAVVRKFVADPRTADRVRLPVRSGEEVALFSPEEAHAALYGPGADPVLGGEVWRSVIRAAQGEGEPYGPWRMLLIWLALPRLSGAVYRVCTRMRATRPDVEAEVVIALLEALPTLDPDFPDAVDALLRTARSRAWRFARSMKDLVPVGYIEDVVRDDSHPGADTADGEDEGRGGVIEVAGPGDLGAPLRFAVSTDWLEAARVSAPEGRRELSDVVRKARRASKRGRRPGTMSRPDGRRP